MHTIVPTSDGETYILHQTAIAVLSPDKSRVKLFTGGWFTATTFRHMNNALSTWGFNQRVSKADFANTDTRILYR